MNLKSPNFVAAAATIVFLGAFVMAMLNSTSETGGGGASMLNEVSSVEKAMEQAKAEGKTVMIDFYADWCPPCKRMASEAFTNESVAKLLSDTLVVRVDVDRPGANELAVEQHRPEALPTVVFLNADGKSIGRTKGYGGVASFKAEIRRILRKA